MFYGTHWSAYHSHTLPKIVPEQVHLMLNGFGMKLVGLSRRLRNSILRALLERIPHL